MIEEQNLPRLMPTDFMPEMTEQIDIDGDEIVVSYARSYGVIIQLGFKKLGDVIADERQVEDLRRTTWQGLELARLGRWDEFQEWSLPLKGDKH